MIRGYLQARRDQPEFFAVTFRGERRKFPVIRVAVSELLFNVDLGRLVLDRLTIIEADAGLDPEDPKVQADIERKVLALRETNDLRQLIEREGQLQAGVATADGFVINGNRRLAVLRDLYRSTSDERFGYMDVAVLPEDATKKELFLLEAGLQMAPDSRVRYGPVTTLVQIRMGLSELGLDKAEVARAMNMDEEEVVQNLGRLNLMTEYLAFVGRHGQYGTLEGGAGVGKYEHFIHIQALQGQHGTREYWPALQRHLFVLVDSGVNFDEIRSIRSWKERGVRFFADTVKEIEGDDSTETAPVGDSDLKGLSDDLGAVDVASGVQSVTLPSPQGSDDDQKAATTLAFERTMEMLDNLKKADKPEELLAQALAKLDAINLPEAVVSGAKEFTSVPMHKLDDLLDRIDSRVKEIRAQLGRIGRNRGS